MTATALWPHLDAYIAHLRDVRHASPNTIKAYRRDIADFVTWPAPFTPTGTPRPL